MRLLAVSGSAAGGSAFSSRQLLTRLADRGHIVTSLVETSPHQPLYVVAESGLGRVVERANRVARRAAGRVARRRAEARPVDDPTQPYTAFTSRFPELVVEELIAAAKPELIIATSISERCWAPLRALATAADVPVVLVVVEAASVARVTEAVPDVIVANAEVHAAAVAAMGFEATVVSSIVEPLPMPPEPDRHVLFVNPIPEYGLARAEQLAAASPTIPFSFVESWPLAPRDRRALTRRARRLGNVTFRRFVAPADLYRGARVVLVPYLDGNRPRVVAEAQQLGLPILGASTPGLVEAVGAAGILVDPAAETPTWAAALDRLWSDDAVRRWCRDAGVAVAGSSQADPEWLVDRWEELLAAAVGPAAGTVPP